MALGGWRINMKQLPKAPPAATHAATHAADAAQPTELAVPQELHPITVVGARAAKRKSEIDGYSATFRKAYPKADYVVRLCVACRQLDVGDIVHEQHLAPCLPD
jgi:hypothetical protein